MESFQAEEEQDQQPAGISAVETSGRFVSSTELLEVLATGAEDGAEFTEMGNPSKGFRVGMFFCTLETK